MNARNWQVVNMKTGEVVATHCSRKRAQRTADRLDLRYGAINFHVREVIP